jgi:hypothetical protein
MDSTYRFVVIQDSIVLLLNLPRKTTYGVSSSTTKRLRIGEYIRIVVPE